MRRIVLLLALTALLVAVGVTGSALAQPAVGKGCEGLTNASETQEPAPLPEALEHNPTKEIPIGGVPNPSQGEEHSQIEDPLQAHQCPGFK